ncbi:MAG TPA: hypothetical protein VF427_13355 [Noviherbaspirillum sp.]
MTTLRKGALSADALDFAPGLLSIQESPPARLTRAMMYALMALFAILLAWSVFGKLVAQFNQAQAANPKLSSWSLMNGLLDAHLAGSDSAALGGDLAYYFGTKGSLSGMDLATAISTVQDAQFGKNAQKVDSWNIISQSASTLR